MALKRRGSGDDAVFEEGLTKRVFARLKIKVSSRSQYIVLPPQTYPRKPSLKLSNFQQKFGVNINSILTPNFCWKFDALNRFALGKFEVERV